MNDPQLNEDPSQQPAKQESSRVRNGLVAAFILAVFAVACLYAKSLFAECDDTYIYLVYAKNFLAGHGATFNGDKVQGFTSLLWLFVIIGIAKLGPSLPTAASVASAASGLLAMFALYGVGRAFDLSRGIALIPVLLMALAGDFAFYMGVGLENVFFVAMMLFSLRFAVHHNPRAALRSWWLPPVLWITVFARPEGVLVAGWVLLVLFLRTRDWLGAVRSFTLFAVLVFAVLYFNRSYYGDWLPNTYYAKAGAGLSNAHLGKAYAGYFVDAYVLTFVALGFAVFTRITHVGRAWILIGLAAVWVVRITIQGGDNLVGFRMLLPVIPLVALAAVYSLRRLSRTPLIYGAIVVTVFQYYSWTNGTVLGSSRNAPVTRQIAGWREAFPVRVDIGLHLKKKFEPGSKVALNAAGIIPYYSELPTIDMLGLNNRHIARFGSRDREMPYAHQAGDGEYVLSQQPAAIIFHGTGKKVGDYYLSDREVQNNKLFYQHYYREALPHDNFVYVRRNVRFRNQK